VLVLTRAVLPFAAASVLAQDPAAELLARLSLEEKAGQLFMSWSLSRVEGKPGDTNHERMLAWVRDAGLGGVILSLGTVDDAAALVPRLQAAAKVPLLLAGDFEGGVWFRLQGAAELGNQMLVGATGSAALAEAMGRVTGEEAKALGFHWVFAPVLDVNSNPANPIINVRSFGEDPELVAKLGCAFARGVRSTGLIPCAKHFPGHGDVDTDSHLALATVPGDGSKLRACELLPFARACREGLESVMTGHLAVPGLGEDPAVPATLSKKILGDVLRGELGFTGLVVTDALEMGGVKNAFPPGEVAVRALLAGADVLLMPPDPLAARAAVVEAVRAGRVPMARLDDAVLRILRAKAKVGLLSGGGQVAKYWWTQFTQGSLVGAGAAHEPSEEVWRATSAGTDEARNVGQQIAARGVTLVRDRGGVLPLALGGDAAITVTMSDGSEAAADSRDLVAQPRSFRLTAASPPDVVARVAAAVGGAKRIELYLHVKVREYSGGIGMPTSWQPVIDALRDEQQVVVVSYGNPYLVQNLPEADVYVATYADTAAVRRTVLAGLRGEGAFLGRLPVTIPGVATAGSGLTQLPGPVASSLPRYWPAHEDMAAALPVTLRQLLEAAIADGAFPGASCLVARRGSVIAEVVAGKQSYAAEASPVTPTTRFDLASLTKVSATTPAVLKLVATNKVSLDDPVQKWLPAFTGIGKDKVTIRHLLAHNGGLPAYERFHRTLAGKDAIVAAAAAEGLMYEPGTGPTYSDLGFILLMAVVEKASGEPFATFVEREVLKPLAMRTATFAPTAGPPLGNAAPTERDEARGGILRGFVHDENAFAMGGVSGHAGLFATANDVAHFGVAMLAGGSGVLPRDLVAAAIQPAGIGDDRTRGLGFQMVADGSWGGTKVPPGTFGHTGFTGTSLWCCSRHDLCVVLLTNRVHPTRVNNKITAVRRAVHDLVLDSVR
jgi:beta-N-acetylhexosaminidase